MSSEKNTEPSKVSGMEENRNKRSEIKFSQQTCLSIIKNGTLLPVLHSIAFRNKTTSDTTFRKNNADEKEELTRVYKRRYWILFLISILGTLNCIPWIQYSIVTHITACYYGVTYFDVNWTSLVYMVVYIPFMVPASWFLNKYGLRLTVLFGSVLNCLSAIIQCTSLNRDGFSIVLVSQTVVAIAHNFISPIPTRLALVWFGPSEVCRAIAVGIIGSQVGSALGFILSPYFLPSDCSDIELVRNGKTNQTFLITVWNILLLLLLIFTFEDKPPIPPSPAEAAKLSKNEYKNSIKALFKNINFFLLLLSYGLNEGVFLAFGTVLNAMLIPLYPDSQDLIGWMGSTMIFAGILGSFAAGYILDRTHKYKETSVTIFALSFLSICGFTGSLHFHGIWVQYVISAILGIFLTSYLSVGLEFASEITYPEPEGTTASLMWSSAMGLGIILTMSSSALIERYGELHCNILFCSALFACIIITGFMKCDYRRTKMNTDQVDEAIKNRTEPSVLNETTITASTYI